MYEIQGILCRHFGIGTWRNKEVEKGQESALNQLDIFEANGGHKPPNAFPEVNGILNHVMEPFHTHHPMYDATFLE